MEREILYKYAQLIVKKGLNIEPGQEVLLIAGLDQPEFVRTVAELCYGSGASRVVTEWTDMPLAKLAQQYQREEKLAEVTPWELARLKWRTDELPALLCEDVVKLREIGVDAILVGETLMRAADKKKALNELRGGAA